MDYVKLFKLHIELYNINLSRHIYIFLQVKDYYEATKDKKYLSEIIAILEKEFNFWQREKVVTVVKGNKTYKMYRYYTDSDGPRPESYKYVISTLANWLFIHTPYNFTMYTHTHTSKKMLLLCQRSPMLYYQILKKIFLSKKQTTSLSLSFLTADKRYMPKKMNQSNFTKVA